MTLEGLNEDFHDPRGKNKEAAGRPKDMADVTRLRKTPPAEGMR